MCALLSRLRSGNSTEESLKTDFAVLNNKIISKSNVVVNDWHDAPIIVENNLLRENINFIKIRQYAQASKNILFVCKSTDQLVKSDSNGILTKRVTGMISIC